ncbi:hypothetical protein [Kocuria sabuli]|uniref:hypothetical protein n=1 Tax=Kocuria sabuli TaxID=3071448 RepID=UPI0034D3B8C6
MSSPLDRPQPRPPPRPVLARHGIRSPARWVATYDHMVHAAAGRWADVTRALHRGLMPVTDDAWEPAR